MMWGRLIGGIAVVLLSVAIVFVAFGSSIGSVELAIVAVTAVAAVVFVVRRASPQ